MIPFVNAHTHQADPSLQSVAILNRIVGRETLPEWGFCSVGIHPWYINDPAPQLAQLREWATHPNVKAIGECGLDRLRGPSLAIQQVVFDEQIALSEARQKPVIIHCVRAFSEVLATYKRLKPTQPWVLHGINNRLPLVQPLLHAGLYASFGAALLRPDSPARQVLLATPPAQILLETDDAKDASIGTIYEAVADCLGWPLERLKEQVWENATRFFGL